LKNGVREGEKYIFERGGISFSDQNIDPLQDRQVKLNIIDRWRAEEYGFGLGRQKE
jgi:hypothetical protein